MKFEQRVCATFRSYQSQINELHEFNEIKFLLRLDSHTYTYLFTGVCYSGLYYALIELNLETKSILQIQKELQKQYLEVLLKSYAEILSAIVDNDDFTPIRVTTYQEEFEIFQAFPLKKEDIEANYNELESPKPDAYPNKLPFSRMVMFFT